MLKDREARNKYQKEWLKARRQKWLQENGPCVNCGSTVRLEVDHIYPEAKITHRVWSWSEERRNAELAKCQVLCYKCHKEKTKIDLASQADHGTYAKYQNGCKCEPCIKAKRDYSRHTDISNGRPNHAKKVIDI